MPLRFGQPNDRGFTQITPIAFQSNMLVPENSDLCINTLATEIRPTERPDLYLRSLDRIPIL